MSEDWERRVSELMDSDFRLEVQKKVEEFRSFRNGDPEKLFFELSFCILTANTSAELGISMQDQLGPRPFIDMSEEELRNALKNARYRFYNTRSRYITSNRWVAMELPMILNHPDPWVAREFLVEKLTGIGYKEASHFLRNCGVFSFAILDKHIIRMVTSGLNVENKPLNRKRYYEMERIIRKKAEEFSMEPGILDLYMWKIATGKLIK